MVGRRDARPEFPVQQVEGSLRVRDLIHRQAVKVQLAAVARVDPVADHDPVREDLPDSREVRVPQQDVAGAEQVLGIVPAGIGVRARQAAAAVAAPLRAAPAAVPVGELLALALGRPADALAAAREILAARPGPREASVAHQAAGIVLRDRGELGAATVELRRARALAAASGDLDREADVCATLGVTLVVAGRARAGLASLDWSVARSRGGAAGRVLMRRATAYYDLGRYEDAGADLTRALPLLRRSGDAVWEARALTWRAEVHRALGRSARAAADYARAERMFADTGQEVEYATARHNLGLVAAGSGDLPRALAYFDEARARFAAVGDVRADQILDRVAVLLAAGLAQEAFAEADAAAVGPDRAGNASKLAELLLAAATAALSARLPAEAQARAASARALFHAQRRPWWAARAEFVSVQARYAGGERGGRLLTQAQNVAARLEALGAEDAPRAHLLAGRLALDRSLGRSSRRGGTGWWLSPRPRRCGCGPAGRRRRSAAG